MTVAAVITVRAGSRRVPNKNIRPFGDSNLLVHKIRQLKKVRGIDKIVVSSDSEEMLRMALDNGCEIQRRPIEYCDEKSKTFNEMVEWVTGNIDADVIVWAPCVCPFADETVLSQGLATFNRYVRGGGHDSVVSAKQFKEYLFDENGPHNFSVEKHVKSQDLPNWNVIVNGFFIARREDMNRWRFVYGKNPKLVTLSKRQAMDIDDMDDFKICETMLDNEREKSMNNKIFQDLFVLELANNHWGDVNRGLKIIDEFARVIKDNGIHAAIKLQFRDVDTFIHPAYRGLTDYRYITKTLATKMSEADYAKMVDAVRAHGLVTMSTPFDEHSVDVCKNLDVDIIKIASSDINDWILIKKIIETGKPVIVSTGGASVADIKKCVNMFNERGIPLAINHCVAQYPTAKENLDLGQITLLKEMFPNNVIGFSTHEGNENIQEAIMMAYAYGARTFERHVDIENPEKGVSPYCSLPVDFDRWVKGYKKAVAMHGGAGTARREIPVGETKYLDALVRGVYARNDLPAGHKITMNDIYLAIPLQKGQLSCREFTGEECLTAPVAADKPVMIEQVRANYLTPELVKMIKGRGL